MRLTFLAVSFLAIIGCNSPVAPVVVGNWGGTQVSLVLAPSGGTVGYQCGAGTVDSTWSFTSDGRFTGSGLHYFGGGPAPAQGRQPHPARYTGQVSGDVLDLTVILTDVNQTLGPFRLVRGGPVVRELCV